MSAGGRARPRDRRPGAADPESGQAIILLVGIVAVAVCLVVALGAHGQALLGKGREQRAADLAAICAAQEMRDSYSRLFAPALLPNGTANPAHLDRPAYMDAARAEAVRCAERNGATLLAGDVEFPDADALAPTRVATALRAEVSVRPSVQGRERTVALRARAEAEIVPGAAAVPSASPSEGEYSGPLAYRQGKPMRPDVALAFDRLSAAARGEARIPLIVTSAFRSNAEQAALFARNPDPRWVAPPGSSLHRLGTELDLGPASAYGWLAANAERFGFVKRYSWEPWHYGYTRNAGTTSVGFGARRGADGRSGGAVPGFVPARYRAPIVRAAQRWNVSAALISAQLYAESGFNPFARSAAAARGIAQFIPSTAAAYGLTNPDDPDAAIDAQAHHMHDLLARFASVPLALAAYNAGAGAVVACGCIPPYPETRAYVAKILGLIGGAGEGTGPTFSVRLSR